MAYDPLFCQENHFEEEEEGTEEESEEWVSSLLDKCRPDLLGFTSGETYTVEARSSAVEWIARASTEHGFAVQTALLAVNYLDRCFVSSDGGSLRLQEDKPWMSCLAAVACLSIAAKIEETRVPLLLDLHWPSPALGFVFDSRTIRRMELLVLSTLEWRMNSVTPLSLARALFRKVPVTAALCEAALLAAAADFCWVQHPPSVWAAAALIYAARPPEIDAPVKLLNVSKESACEAYRVILKLCGSSDFFRCNKRKLFNCRSPESPNCLIGSCFTCESSSSSEIPPLKKSSTDQICDNGESKGLMI